LANTTTNLASPLLQQALLGEALDESSVLVFVADELMRYVAVNQRACKVLGYTREEILGLRVTDIAVAPDAPVLYEGMLQSGAQGGVTLIRCKDDRTLSFRYAASEVRIGPMPYFVSVGTIDDSTP
jgi:PAS domain S-box-containing protein